MQAARQGMAAADASQEKNSGLEARKALAEKVYAALAKAIPEPKAELKYSSVYELLTAVMLSAQATDASVNRATPALFAAAPTPQDMVALGVAGIAQALILARRSKRRGWWILIILSSLLLIFGILVFINPLLVTPKAIMEIIGATLIYSAAVSLLSLIWIWPIHKK